VTIMKLDEGDTLVAVKRVPHEEGNGAAETSEADASEETA
jgi:hypothetical protein